MLSDFIIYGGYLICFSWSWGKTEIGAARFYHPYNSIVSRTTEHETLIQTIIFFFAFRFNSVKVLYYGSLNIALKVLMEVNS